MLTRRTVPLLVAVLAGAAVLAGCTYSAEPAPGSPKSPAGFSTRGFPPPPAAQEPALAPPPQVPALPATPRSGAVPSQPAGTPAPSGPGG